MQNYPLLAGPLFWIGGVAQVVQIVREQSAAGVSSLHWGLAVLILAGYGYYYWLFVEPGTPRRNSILISLTSAGLYTIIFVLTLLY